MTDGHSFLFFPPYSLFNLLQDSETGCHKTQQNKACPQLGVAKRCWSGTSCSTCCGSSPAPAGTIAATLLLPLKNEQKRRRPDRAMVRDRTGNINRRVCCQNPTRPLLAGLPAASGNAGPSEDSAAKSTRRETSRMSPQFCGFHARSAGGGAREVSASTNPELRDTPTSSVKICIRVSPYLTSSSVHN